MLRNLIREVGAVINYKSSLKTIAGETGSKASRKL